MSLFPVKLQQLFYNALYVAALGIACTFFPPDAAAVESLTNEKTVDSIEFEASRLAGLWTSEAVSDAIYLYLEAAELAKKSSNHSKAASCLRAAGELMLWQNKGDSESVLNEAIDIESGTSVVNLEGRARTLYLLIKSALKNNELHKARLNFVRSLVLANKTQNPALFGLAYLSQGEILYRQRDIESMINVQEKALVYFKDANDQLKQAETLTYLSYSYGMNNDRLKSIEIARESVNLNRELSNRRGLAFALIAFGDGNQRIGELKKAKEAFDEAESIFPEDLNLNEKASLFTKIGMYYESLNDLMTAKRYFQNAQTFFQISGNLYGSSELLTVIGQTSMQLGDVDEAITFFKIGLDQSQKLRDSWSLGLVNENIGDAYLKSGEINLAESHYLQALSFVENSKNVAFRTASVKHSLGHLYERKGEMNKARFQYDVSLNISKKIGDRSAMSETLFCKARILTLQNHLDVALDTISESLNLAETINTQTDNSQLRITHFSNVADRYELYIHLLMRKDRDMPARGFALRALAASERSRSRVLLENIQFSDGKLNNGQLPELLKSEQDLISELNSKRSKLLELLSVNTNAEEITKAGDDVRDTERELEDIRAQLRQSDPLYTAIRSQTTFDVESFQRDVLDDETLFVEFSLGDTESYLWLINKNEVFGFTLPSRTKLEAKADRVLELIKARERKSDDSIDTYDARVTAADEAFPVAAASLSDDLFGQIAEHIRDKRLVISLDGKMGHIPIGALPFPYSRTENHLIATNEIIYTPSASILQLLNISRQKERVVPKKDLIVFADPVFSPADERFSEKFAEKGHSMVKSTDFTPVLDRLPGSQKEASAVSEWIQGATVVSGFSAKRERVLNNELGDYKIIHFATHSIANEKYPELSGILLSLYDEKGESSEGFVRTADIYGMNLNADLVVLSSCNSGIGKQIRGEGTMSVGNAFIQAGTRSVVSSLWKVDDAASMQLMSDFYQLLSDGTKTPSHALRDAQIRMSTDKRYSSPFFWAAFTAQGAYSRPIGITPNKTFSPLFLTFAGMLGAILLIFCGWTYSCRNAAYSMTKL